MINNKRKNKKKRLNKVKLKKRVQIAILAIMMINPNLVLKKIREILQQQINYNQQNNKRLQSICIYYLKEIISNKQNMKLIMLLRIYHKFINVHFLIF